MDNDLRRIIEEELEFAKARIFERLNGVNRDQLTDEDAEVLAPLPDNEKYKQALELYKEGSSHSKVARDLNVSMGSAKRYFNWLVVNGYLEAEPEELSEREKDVVERLFLRGMSLNKTAEDLGVSVSNVIQRRNNAIRKGYKPPVDKGGVNQ